MARSTEQPGAQRRVPEPWTLPGDMLQPSRGQGFLQAPPQHWQVLIKPSSQARKPLIKLSSEQEFKSSKGEGSQAAFNPQRWPEELLPQESG